ncbi:exosome complex component RRP43-like isoform X2 [Gordionus sp. m RMFG-2023]|uniref:exosome complex component RRP43-like isoform X2 n=1 Tax=Gordionus sp. m RMFG-2023 TaxID=3053472 RepID=UPI0031FBB440
MLKNFLPKEFYEKCLEANLRPDYRKYNEYRNINLSGGSITCANGSSLIKIGNTIVTCGVQAKLNPFDKINPYEIKIEEIFNIRVHIPAICHLQFKNDMILSDYILYLRQFVIEAFESSNIIDYKDFLTMKEKYIWEIICDIMCINDDGNLQDALLLSLVAALKNTKIPIINETTVSTKENIVNTDENMIIENANNQNFNTDNKKEDISKNVNFNIPDDCPTQNLILKSAPISVTFVYFDKQIIVDPTSQEEQLATGKISIILSDSQNEARL